VATTEWQIGHLELRANLVWFMAVSSLKVRIARSFLTGLTITTATAFMMYLLTMPRTGDPTERQSWYLMLGLSLVVSTAGVLNAMLMSVSQRYREIGTMKCLGALDSLVLYSVLAEAAILGLVGAVAGVVVGTVLSLLLGLAAHGTALLSYLQWAALPVKVAVVFLVGMVLTTVGASVPAWIAAKMPPVEAMRGEK
jgi:ABC-type antimicrobial peptide transport system permease subunit